MAEFSYGEDATLRDIETKKEFISGIIKLMLKDRQCKIDKKETEYGVIYIGTQNKSFEIHETKSNEFGTQYTLFVDHQNISDIFSKFELENFIKKIESRTNGNAANNKKSDNKISEKVNKVYLYLQNSIQKD